MNSRHRYLLIVLLGIGSLVIWNILYSLIYDARRLSIYGKAALKDALTTELEASFFAPALNFYEHLPTLSEILNYGLKHFYLTTALMSLAMTVGIIVALYVLLTRKRQDDIHGNARLMLKAELREHGLKTKGGLFLGKTGNIDVRDEDQSHVMVIGPPSSGKTECFVIPNLIEWEGSFIALDFKGTLFERTAKIRKKRGDEVYLFGPGYENSHTYNPLDMIRTGVTRITDIQALASLLVPVLDEKNSHWNNSAQMLLTGMISYVLESVECANNRTLGTVGRLFSVSDSFHDTLKSMRDEIGVSSFTYSRLTEFLAIPQEEAGSIRSTLNTHLKPWQNPSIEALTQSGENSIQIEQLREKAMSVYLVIDTGQIEIFAPLLKLFLEQVNSFVNRAYRKPEENKILFMIDEFYQLGKINSIIKQLPFARDRDIRICLVSQGVAQIDEKFTRAGRESILASCVLQLFCSFNDEPTVELVTKKAGQKTVHYKTNSRQMEPFGKPSRRTESEHAMAQPLFRSNELYAWDRNKLLIFKVNAQPYVCNKVLADKAKIYVKAVQKANHQLVEVPPLIETIDFLPSWATRIRKKTANYMAEGKALDNEKLPGQKDYQKFLQRIPPKKKINKVVTHDALMSKLNIVVGEEKEQ